MWKCEIKKKPKHFASEADNWKKKKLCGLLKLKHILKFYNEMEGKKFKLT